MEQDHDTSLGDPEANEQVEKQRILWQLAELFSGIAQEEEVLRQAATAEEQLEARVSSLRHAVEHAEAELRERGQQASFEPDERMRSGTSTAHDSQDDDVPEEMLRELEDLHVEIENLQDRNEYLQLALQQANDALDHADDDRPSAPAQNSRTQAAQQEVEELEREIARLRQREEKMVEEQRNRILEIQEGLLYIEAQSRDERSAVKEEIQALSAENEVLEVEIDGVKAGSARCINRLEREEQHLKEEVASAKVMFESRREMQSSQVQELERKCKVLKEATEESQRLSSDLPEVHRQKHSRSQSSTPRSQSLQSQVTDENLLLQWKGAEQNRRPDQAPKTLNRTNSRNLRRARSSLLNSYHAAGASRVNLDESEDALSVDSSDSGVNRGLDALILAGKRPDTKLSIIGEDSTITGDGSNCSSSNAEDAMLVNVEGSQAHDRSSPSDGMSKRAFSLLDEDERLSLESPTHDASLELNYDALERMGKSSISALSTSASGALVVAMDSGDEDSSVSPDTNNPHRRSSIGWRYDHLDVGDAVASLANEPLADELEI
jgi:hypothetical protein|eukprot:CAMPEP_0169087560 /NCGR_PEP_ID=MMETSP1015-20121227/14295_1 /TAXON_ID=342587 /ORGANISM="Karlodinium micrum, Strain CCMP2283" /LENGTH=551 /DNA_ID=CAMNT_0009147795 /DNA_START=88 /DNA_END=1743 /DNA_ORIENTATION=+